MAVSGEEATAMFPEPGPDAFAVGTGEAQFGDGVAREEFKTAFAMWSRQGDEAGFHFEQKHQPVRISLETEFTDDTGQVEIARLERELHFFFGLATGAGVGRFAIVSVKLASGGTPETTIGLLGAFQQQHFVAIVEAVEQRGDFIGQTHRVAVSGSLGDAVEFRAGADK